MITTLSTTIWLLSGLIAGILTQYTHNGLHNIKPKDVLFSVLAAVSGPLCVLILIRSHQRGSNLYVPKHLRYNRSRINRLSLKDKHLFFIWRNAESEGNFPKLLDLLFGTGYFKEKLLVIKFITTRKRDFKLYCKVQRLIEEDVSNNVGNSN